MTKKEFLQGNVFTGNSVYLFRFRKNEQVPGAGYIAAKINGGWEHYMNVEKINYNHASCYFVGVIKIHKERIKLSDLQLVDEEKR